MMASDVVQQHSDRLRVMLVDDHPLLRAGVRQLLEGEADLQIVGEADGGVSAVQLAQELSPDVIVIDVSLPDLGGAEATRQILASQPTIRVLALTAHEETAFARMLLDSGAVGYALKRSACEELVRAIRIVAAGGTYVDPMLAGSLLRNGHKRIGTSGLPAVSLSEREAEVIRMIAQGHTSKEMAQTLALSPRTLETYKARAMTKLNLRSRADLIRYALRSGWLRDS
jgi:DNA-binding NarL/FixJ family response regulator